MIKVKTGDFLRNKNTNIIFRARCDFTITKDDSIREIWSPKTDELCIFYNDYAESVRIAKFKQVAYGKNRRGLYKDAQGNYFENCIPFTEDAYNEILLIL